MHEEQTNAKAGQVMKSLHYACEFKYQTVVVLLLTALEKKTHFLREDGETPVQTDALLYVSHTLLMVGILEEVCLLHRPRLLPEALLYTLVYL